MFNMDNVIGFNDWVDKNKAKFIKEHPIEEKDLNFSEFAEYGGGVEEGEEFKNDEPVDSKGMTGIPDEDYSGASGNDR